MITMSFLAMWLAANAPDAEREVSKDATVVKMHRWWEPCCKPIAEDGGGLICEEGCRINFSPLEGEAQ
jgi:hypothetical protein